MNKLKFDTKLLIHNDFGKNGIRNVGLVHFILYLTRSAVGDIWKSVGVSHTKGLGTAVFSFAGSGPISHKIRCHRNRMSNVNKR